MGLGGIMSKTIASRAVIIRINIAFLVFLMLAYITILLLQPTSLFGGRDAASFVRCSFRDCGILRKEYRSETTPNFLEGLHGNARLGLVNMEEDEVIDLGIGGKATVVNFERVPDSLTWNDLFPYHIDEEEKNVVPSCPKIPMPDLSAYEEMDVVVAKLPCRKPADGWNRDVFRLQVHLVAANLAARRGRRDRRGAVKVLFLSKCEPMRELFRCDDLVTRKGERWMYEAEVERLEEKLRLPVGSCKLALPLWQEGTHSEFNVSNLASPRSRRGRREAYATVIHSSDAYLCGAITLAQSIRRTGSTRDLVLLHDHSITQEQRHALATAGWTLRKIKRIRNPRAKKHTYNEYNYSKFRLWQLTDYDKIIFIDADILVLRNLDHLFHFPQLSAVSNSRVIFNSGVIVIEPSNCTFNSMMLRRWDVLSYNGGDQGFLNEMFAWWHRLPKRVNYLKYFTDSMPEDRDMKEHLFDAEPPKLYAMHSLGVKPWRCYRDYDCNWNIDSQRTFASDAAHRQWWRLHDEMEEGLREFCRLTEQRKMELEWDRKEAEKRRYDDGHWRMNITDRRKDILKRET
ncbi:UDP-glucuronate:xylan alpha-glucuronosyltransferase 2-like [Typha angustifolia]|uniref:UDP-glucuronate:xylan alpha-glucuronosyltransferase 2-like n=1 Tax=Typha angustifolia TaxID=59011 RepID=UPI003C2F969D